MTIPLKTIMDMVKIIFPDKYASLDFTYASTANGETESHWELYVAGEIKCKRFDSLLEVVEHLKTIYNGRRLEKVL